MFSMRDIKDLKNLDKDDVLEVLGLETRRDTMDWMLPTLSAFSVGLLLGAGLGLLMAPKPGAQLRDDLRSRLQGGQDALANAVEKARAETTNRT
jgi:hypothetical protein